MLIIAFFLLAKESNDALPNGVLCTRHDFDNFGLQFHSGNMVAWFSLWNLMVQGT